MLLVKSRRDSSLCAVRTWYSAGGLDGKKTDDCYLVDEEWFEYKKI